MVSSSQDLLELEFTFPIDHAKAPITRYADFLRVLKDLTDLGMPMKCTNEKRKSDNELVVNISLQDPIMYAMINDYINLNNQLSSDKIDKEEYDMELEDSFLKFDIPILPK